MADNALYFPYINVPNSSWFSRSLLYFDRVACIMPYEIALNLKHVDYHTQELMRAELLTPVMPHYYIICSTLAHNFMTFLWSLPKSEIELRRVRLRENHKGAYVHRDKLEALILVLVHTGLAQRTETEWLFVEEQTASEYLAALAALICHTGSEWNRPITDEPNNLQPFLSSGDVGRIGLDGLRGKLLQRAFPAPVQPLTAEEIRKFKTQYGTELITFRRYIEEQVLALATMSDLAARDYKMQLLESYLAEESKRIRSYMQSRGWCTAPFDLVWALLEDLNMPGANLLTRIVNQALGEHHLASGPLAYAGFAQYELGLASAD